MNRKLMLLVAGALTALAFTALPGAASAEETTLKCLTGAPCEYTVHGGQTKFSIKGGDTVNCASITGSGSVTGLNAEKESTTTANTFFFHECKEQNTIFHFACTVPGQPSGTAKIEATGHNVKLPVAEAPTEAGVLLTLPAAGVTFSCAGGFAQTTVTGNIIGEFEKKCGAESKGKEQKVNFTAEEDGVQLNKTYTSKTYDLIGATSHASTPSETTGYVTAAQKGTGILTFNQEVELTCKA
ncbi:MAG TPA: hypothetical protein VLK37_10160 [Solirubrobacterales bacterium]|nr:hypothetical protein [Solirubrobacterales bacterium]